jgi:hypothetical protein
VLVRNLHTFGPVVNEVYEWGHGTETPSKVHFVDRSQLKKAPSIISSTGGFTSISSTVIVNVTAISAGRYHHVALTSNHSVYTWGLGSEQLGHGDTNSTSVSSPHFQSQPQLVETLLPVNGGARVVAISATGNRTCAVTDVGDVHTWGATYHKVSYFVLFCFESGLCLFQGVLSPGPTSFEPLPKRVAGIKRAVSVAAGEDHTLVVISTTLPPLPLAELYYLHDDRVENDLRVSRFRDDYQEDDGSDSDLDDRYALQFIKTDLAKSNEIGLIGDEGVFENENHVSDTQRMCVRSVPTLKDICQRQLASSLDLQSSLTGLLLGEGYDAPLLRDYSGAYLRM